MPQPKPGQETSDTDHLKVAFLPMTSLDDKGFNLQLVKNAIASLSSDVELLCLPENSLYINLGKNPIPKDQAFSLNSPEIKELQALCLQHKLHLHLGGLPWWRDGDVYNEALVIDAKGECHETYEKMHLFDVNLGPGVAISESRSYTAGHRLNTFQVNGWTFATIICYDLRFPEIFIHYIEQGVDAFLVPSAFTTKTGEIHWKTLLQARAIESQCYVIAPAQVGYHRNPKTQDLRKSWGQSLAVNPWGRVMAETSDYRDFLDSGIVEHAPIEMTMLRSDIESYRSSVPIQQHRRYKVRLEPK